MNRIAVLTAGVIALFAVAFSPCARAQNLYVGFAGGGDIRGGAINNVTVLNSNGAIINSFGDNSNGFTPQGLVFDSAGSLYVADLLSVA